MKRKLLVTPILTTLSGIAVASLCLFLMLKGQNDEINSGIRSETNYIRETIEREFDKTESLLKGIKGFIHSSRNVTKKEFDTYCSSTLNQRDQLHLIEWQPKVRSEDRSSLNKKALDDGITNFRLFELDDQGNQVSPKKRPFHFPVYFSYPLLSDYQTVGLDLSFSPIRMKSKYRSMRLGEPVTSETFPIITKDNPKRNAGFAITYPVFNDSSITSSNDLKHLKGFIAIVLYTDEFFKPLNKVDSRSYFQFEVRDSDDEGVPIYSTVDEVQDKGSLSQKVSINVGNRSWELIVYPTDKYIKKKYSYFHWMIWCLMVAISFSLGIYAYVKAENKQKLNLYERQLQQKQRLESLGILASGIAHEFNNILHCISLTSEHLSSSKKYRSGHLHEDESEKLKIILDYCRRGSELVRQILSFARKDTGSYKEFLLSEEIIKTMDLIQSSSKKGIEYKIEIPQVNDIPIYMNINHVSQILINLCNNAAHSMDHHGIIVVSYHITSEEHIISVKDQGHGIKYENIDLIFDPFFTTKPANEGTGLGLSVIFGIVKSYNGDIEVESKIGEGSVFKVKLPL